MSPRALQTHKNHSPWSARADGHQMERVPASGSDSSALPAHSGEWINHPKTGGEWGVPNEKATGGEDKASGGDQGPSREERGEHMRKIKRGKKKKRGIWCLVCGRSRRDRRERETTKGHRREDSCGEVIEMGCGARGVGQSAHGGETKGRG